MSHESLKKQILELPEEERAELAHLLIESLNPQAEIESEEVWSKELKKRIDQFERGESSSKPWSEVKRTPWRSSRNDQAHIRLDDPAEVEFYQIVEYYEQFDESLSIDFIHEFDRAVIRLQKHPQAGSPFNLTGLAHSKSPRDIP